MAILIEINHSDSKKERKQTPFCGHFQAAAAILKTEDLKIQKRLKAP